MQTTEGEAAAALVAEDPFADEQDDNDIASAAPPSRHLSTSSDGSSVEIGVGEEVCTKFRSERSSWC